MTPSTLPLDLTLARNAAADLLHCLRDVLGTVRGRAPHPAPEPLAGPSGEQIENLGRLIRCAEQAVAPVEGELLNASRRVQSAHRETIELAKNVRVHLEQLRAGLLSPDAVHNWLTRTSLEVNRVGAGTAHGLECDILYTTNTGIDFEVSRAAARRMMRPPTPSGDDNSVVGRQPQRTTAPRSKISARTKRSVVANGPRAKLIAALLLHHRYEQGSCLNTDPLGNNALAKAAEVSRSTASAFFAAEFNGHTRYKTLCRDVGQLSFALRLLIGDVAPRLLCGGRPPGEVDPD